MPMMDDVYGGNTLKAEDVPADFRRVFTIERCNVQLFSDRDSPDVKEKKVVVYFVGASKGLALNVTNANMLAEIARSRDYDFWPGVKVVLYRTTTDYAGRRVPALRLDHPPGAAPQRSIAPAPAPAPMAAPQPQHDDFTVSDDDVPF